MANSASYLVCFLLPFCPPLLRKWGGCEIYPWETYEWLLRGSSWQFENMRKPKKTYECLLTDQVWQTGRCKNRRLTYSATCALALTLDFIIVYKTDIISVSLFSNSRCILCVVIPLKSWKYLTNARLIISLQLIRGWSWRLTSQSIRAINIPDNPLCA